MMHHIIQSLDFDVWEYPILDTFETSNIDGWILFHFFRWLEVVDSDIKSELWSRKSGRKFPNF